MEPVRVFGKRILLVEDDPSAREATTLLLRIDRHEVTEATNGREALGLLSQQGFDLVILDYAMPEMPGSEVALQMKRIAPGLPILMVTAYIEKLGDSDKPVDAILAKPFGVEDLRQEIARLTS